MATFASVTPPPPPSRDTSDTLQHMNISNKGFIVPLLLLLIAIFFIGGGSYAYLQTKQLPVAAHILLDASDQGYNDRTDYEKVLIQKIKSLPEMKNLGYDDPGSTLSLENYLINLKYYDEKTVVFNIPFQNNSGLAIFIYDINTLKQLNQTNLPSIANYDESENYIVLAVPKEKFPAYAITTKEFLLFYKKGALNFQIVPDSVLSEPETYESWCRDSVCTHEIAIDDLAKMVTADVFKNNFQATGFPRDRTMRFKLP